MLLPVNAASNVAFFFLTIKFTNLDALETYPSGISATPQGLPKFAGEPRHHLHHHYHAGEPQVFPGEPKPRLRNHKHSRNQKTDGTGAWPKGAWRHGGSGATSHTNHAESDTTRTSNAAAAVGFAHGLGGLSSNEEPEEKPEEVPEEKPTGTGEEIEGPENYHSGKPGAGGKPMVPRTHEHGETEEKHEWSYEDPSDWKEGYAKCGGKAQSPVNLPGNISNDTEKIEKLQVSYVPLEGLHLDNNGHTLQVNGQFGNLTLKGGTYQAQQLNFHFPSEHEVNGKLFPGEMHIVHQKVGANSTNDLAIIGILLDTEHLWPTVGHLVYPEAEFMIQLGFDVPRVFETVHEAPSAAPAAAPAPPGPPASTDAPCSAELPKEGTSRPIDSVVDIGKIFEQELSGGYYHYEGSLTTPPCSQTVQWFILDRPAPVTQAMVDNFKKLFPDPANNRPVQALNDREVEWSADTISSTPVPVAHDSAPRGSRICFLMLGLLVMNMNA